MWRIVQVSLAFLDKDTRNLGIMQFDLVLNTIYVMFKFYSVDI